MMPDIAKELSMKRLLLAAMAALTLTVPAAAQYYGNPYSQPYEEEWVERSPAPRYYERRPDYGYRPEPRYGYEPRREYRDGYRQDYRYAQPRGERQRRAQGGSICVTSRGSCQYPQPMSNGANCTCDIPGFGVKRGNIQR
jgi:hypothetical protein